ncbi:hypothetical protein Ddye_025682 [Dipteronia dyeriana]|uniref:Uncharacterized protein n=1 Tax=Dipteronia dyeriana TaxID=168575 RepID=A0AAD9TLA9_9ROSI|nr:hypothetical protein Ddye_025682 [Dipteronia dyeriana]
MKMVLTFYFYSSIIELFTGLADFASIFPPSVLQSSLNGSSEFVTFLTYNLTIVNFYLVQIFAVSFLGLTWFCSSLIICFGLEVVNKLNVEIALSKDFDEIK